MPKVPAGTKASKEDAPRNQKPDPTWEEVNKAVCRGMKSLDKLMTQFILSDEYINASASDKRRMCMQSMYTFMGYFFDKHFDRIDIKFACEGIIADIIKKTAVRMSPEAYVAQLGNPNVY